MDFWGTLGTHQNHLFLEQGLQESFCLKKTCPDARIEPVRSGILILLFQQKRHHYCWGHLHKVLRRIQLVESAK